jgi:hypothetical protein
LAIEFHNCHQSYGREDGVLEIFAKPDLVISGTTLPELAVNITAIKQGKAEMAVGNVLGSCIFNTSYSVNCFNNRLGNLSFSA